MAVRRQPHLFTVEEYYRMAQTGILGEDDRVELINGEIVEMTAIGSRHQACVDRLNALFSRLLAGAAVVRVQGPIRLDDYSEPEPDVALLRARRDYYADGHPGPGDVLLVVEVADSSAAYDTGPKALLYAVAGIPEVWILDLTLGEVQVCRSPGGNGYGEVGPLRPGAQLVPLAFPELRIDVDDLLVR
jgi:Uma2 family endonuclease